MERDKILVAQALYLRQSGSAQDCALRDMLRAMQEKYQDDMLDAKPEDLVSLQLLARQMRQMLLALESPEIHTPTI